MKKITVSSVDERVQSGDALLISISERDYLVGRILTVLETGGLPEKQEGAIKSLLKQEVNAVFGPGRGSIYVDNNLSPLIRQIQYKKQESTEESYEPIQGDYELTFIPKEK